MYLRERGKNKLYKMKVVMSQHCIDVCFFYFRILGDFSEPLIVQRSTMESMITEDIENKIYTLVKDREKLFHRQSVQSIRCSETKLVLKKIILWTKRLHRRSETAKTIKVHQLGLFCIQSAFYHMNNAFSTALGFISLFLGLWRNSQVKENQLMWSLVIPYDVYQRQVPPNSPKMLSHSHSM